MSEFMLDPETFWHSRAWLQYVHADAKFRRLNPFALLLAVLARLSALTPPNVTVQVSPHDRPMSLNLNVVLVGAAGTGKGKTLREARELLPTPEGNRMQVKKPRTGEGIVTAFVDRTEQRDEDGRIHKGQYVNKIKTDRVLLELSEVTDLRTAMAGEGSTMLGTLLSGFSGETLGGNTRTARSNVTLPPNTYRLSRVLAAQPSQCDLFFANAEVGFASRFLFAPAGDPLAPDVQPPAPQDTFPALADGIPQGPDDAQLATLRNRDGVPYPHGAGMLAWPAHVIHLPPVAAQEADRLQLLGTRGELGDLDAHRLEPAARLTALFAMADGREEANEEDWELANACLHMSDDARSDCLAQMQAASRRRKVQRAADDKLAKVEAEAEVLAQQVNRAKEIILNYLTKHDAGREGKNRGEFTPRLKRIPDEARTAAFDELVQGGEIDTWPSERGTVYALAITPPGV